MLQFYVPMDFLERPIYDTMRLDKLLYYSPKHHQKIKSLIQMSIRTALVIVTGNNSLYAYMSYEVLNKAH